MTFFKSIFLSLLLSGAGLAQNFESIFSKALDEKKLSAEERKLLVKLVLRKHELYLSLLQKSSQNENGDFAKNLLEEASKPPREDEGDNRMGAAIGWFIDYQGSNMTAFPIISKIHKGAAADTKGMKVGDVLWKLEGESLHHPHSRNHFVQLLKVWPAGAPMNFEIKRNPKHPSMDLWKERRKKVSISINLPSRQP